MCTQNHVTGVIEDSIGGICSAVIKYLIDFVFDALRCGSLLLSSGTKANDQLVLHGSIIIYKCTNDALDAFCALVVQRRTCVVFWG